MGTIKIGEIEAAPGTKTFGYMPVRLPSELRTSIPVGLVNGTEEGPTLCLLAGHHGLEYPGIEAVIRVYSQTNPNTLRGAVITVPVVNLLGFQRKVPYLCPVDGLNIAMVYPGDPTGSLSYAIAHKILNDIVSKADYAMDHHGADLFESLDPFVLFCKIGEKDVIEKAEGMAKALGINFHSPVSFHMNLMVEGPKRGTPTLLVEAGGIEWSESSIDVHSRAIENVMKHLGMMQGDLKTNAKEDTRRSYAVRTRFGGIWYPRVKASDVVSKGETLGEIRDLDSTVREVLHSPCNGTVTFLWTCHVLDPNYQVMTIASED